MVRSVQFLTESIRLHIPREDEFDFLTLTLSLLINLIESSNGNRRLLIDGKLVDIVKQSSDIIDVMTDVSFY